MCVYIIYVLRAKITPTLLLRVALIFSASSHALSVNMSPNRRTVGRRHISSPGGKGAGGKIGRYCFQAGPPKPFLPALPNTDIPRDHYTEGALGPEQILANTVRMNAGIFAVCAIQCAVRWLLLSVHDIYYRLYLPVCTRTFFREAQVSCFIFGHSPVLRFS